MLSEEVTCDMGYAIRAARFIEPFGQTSAPLPRDKRFDRRWVVRGFTITGPAAKAATQTIPIVFQIGTDPVKVGLVASLARPGGNITGITIITVELIAKCLELMHDLMPPGTMIAALVNPANITQTATEREILQATARVLGARVMILNASSPSEIEPVFATLVGERAAPSSTWCHCRSQTSEARRPCR